MAASLLTAVLTQSIGLFLIGAVFVFLASSHLLSGERMPWKTLARLAGVGGLLLIPFAFWLAPHFYQRDWIPPAGWMQTAKVFFESMGIHPYYLSGKPPGFDALSASPLWQKLVLAWGLLSATLVLCLVPFGDWRKHAPYFYAFVALWFQLIFCSLFFRPVLIGRTALMALVPLIAFLALQSATLRAPSRLAALGALGSLCLISTLAWASFGAYLPQENWKKVFTTLEREWHAGDVLVLAPWWLAKEGIGKYHFPVPEADVLTVRRPDNDVGYQRNRFRKVFEQKLKTSPGFRVFLITRKFRALEWNDILIPTLRAAPEKLVEGPIRLYLWETPLKTPRVASGKER